MCIVELISTGDGQIMETLVSIGIKLCWLHFKNISCIFCLFVLCSASVNALQIVFSNSLCGSTAK